MKYNDSILLITSGGSRRGCKSPDVIIIGYFVKQCLTSSRIAYKLDRDTEVRSVVHYCLPADVVLVNGKPF